MDLLVSELYIYIRMHGTTIKEFKHLLLLFKLFTLLSNQLPVKLNF